MGAEFYPVTLLDTNFVAYCMGKSNPTVSGQFCVLTESLVNIYTSKAKASVKRLIEADPNALCTASGGVIITVTGRSWDSTNNYVIFTVQAGNVTGYMNVGKVKNTSGSTGKPEYNFDKKFISKFGFVRNQDSYQYSTLNKAFPGCISNTYSKVTYAVFNKIGTSVNSNALAIDSNTDGINISDYDADSSSSTTIQETDSGPGEIKLTSAFFYNMDEHIFGTEDEQSRNKQNSPSFLRQLLADAKPGDTAFNYSKLKYVFGSPYQFLPTTDMRLSVPDVDNSLEYAGYEFANKIVANMNLLYITPGNTSFMGSTSKKDRRNFIQELGLNFVGGDDSESSLETMFGEYTGKLYTITPAYKEYFNYVNPMCRAGAIFLNIGGCSFNQLFKSSGDVMGNYDIGSEELETLNDKVMFQGSSVFANMNWGVAEGQAYEFYEELETTEDEEAEEVTEETPEEVEEVAESERKAFEMDYTGFWHSYESSPLGSLAEGIKNFEHKLYTNNSVAFYVNSEYSFQESFSNETTDSLLATTVNSLSDRSRELQFLLGTAKGAVGEAFDRISGGAVKDIKNSIDAITNKISGGNSIFSTLVSSVKAIVSGGRMLFPQIWSNSGFNKSYSVNIKLNCPNPDPVSWYLNIYVPICHLIALVCPRSEYVNTYTTPFIIKAFYKGMFNIDMGIITEMTINRGKEGSWSADALPLSVDVSFTIQDLYSNMGITSSGSMFKGHTLQNVAELDYIANMCGLNINEPDSVKMGKYWYVFNISSALYDIIPNLYLGIRETISNKVTQAYKNFWF